mgnify:CR=1 FL=1
MLLLIISGHAIPKLKKIMIFFMILAMIIVEAVIMTKKNTIRYVRVAKKK